MWKCEHAWVKTQKIRTADKNRKQEVKDLKRGNTGLYKIKQKHCQKICKNNKNCNLKIKPENTSFKFGLFFAFQHWNWVLLQTPDPDDFHLNVYIQRVRIRAVCLHWFGLWAYRCLLFCLLFSLRIPVWEKQVPMTSVKGRQGGSFWHLAALLSFHQLRGCLWKDRLLDGYLLWRAGFP